MSSWLSYITGSGSKDTSASAGKAKNAIIELRQQLLMIDKQEEHMMKKIDDENQKAKVNATTNKRGKHKTETPHSRGRETELTPTRILPNPPTRRSDRLVCHAQLPCKHCGTRRRTRVSLIV